MVHPACGFVVRVDGIFIADLLSSAPLLMHVCPPYELSSETPALSPRQLYVYTHILKGFLQGQTAVLRFNTTAGLSSSSRDFFHPIYVRLEQNTMPFSKLNEVCQM